MTTQRLAILICLFAASTGSSAELTRVASSFEEKDPFGMFLDFSFDWLSDQATIVREWYQDGALQDVNELHYSKFETKLGIDVNLGIYKDVELHVGVPIVFAQDREWTFDRNTDESNTTIYRNCTLDPAGTSCANPAAGGDGRLFEVPASSFRGGLGDFTFGLAWNPLVQKKDPAYPTWTLRFNYTAPTATVLNPSVPTSISRRGNIGEKVHRYTFSTAVSRRLNRYFEPYFQLHYTLPWRAPGSYSNCDDPSPDRLGHPLNCGRNVWVRDQTGIQPAHTGGALFGTEMTVFEREDRFQRLAIDLRAFVNYTSAGRYYNEMSDLFGKLLTTSDSGQLGGQIAFVGQAAEFIKLKASTSLAYNTERFLTNEVIGRDLNNNQAVDVDTHPEEYNPNYDARIDRAGRRFRIQEQYVFRLQISATFNF